MFEDLAGELDKIARLVKADVDPGMIGKKENSGENIPKNRSRFRVMTEEANKAQQAPNAPTDKPNPSVQEGISEAASAYRGGMNNIMFLGSKDPLTAELSKIASSLETEGFKSPNPAAITKKAEFRSPESIGTKKNSGEGVQSKLNDNFDWLSDFQRQQRAPEPQV